MHRAWDRLYRAGAPYHGPAPAPWFADGVVPGGVVLDLGCGAGKSLRALRDAGPRWRLVGVDASRPAARLARGLADVVQADAGALPLRPASCDAVRVDHLLGHLGPEGAARAAAEVERVLRPGGFLAVREFARGDLRDGAGRAVGPATFERGGVPTRYFAPSELAALFPRCAGEERAVSRAVRFAPTPRRFVELRARRA